MKLIDLPENSQEQKIAKDNCILLIRSGSTLYGTNTEESDDDAIGIFMEPEEYILGRKKIEMVEFRTNKSDSGVKNKKGDVDIIMYSLRRYIALAENNNPTICELFFAPENCILHINDLGKQLMEAYPLFISKKLYFSHCGYAYSQIDRNKIKSGNNTGRKELIDKFGYDTKLMSHAVRLYIEAVELLSRGCLEFPLKENRKILDIKRGLWDYEKCMEECKKLEEFTKAIYISSTVQHSPNKKEIDKFQIKMIKQFLRY